MLGSLAAVAGLGSFRQLSWGEEEAGAPLFSKIGMNSGLEQAREVDFSQAGVGFLQIPVASLLVPDQDEEAFEAVRRQLSDIALPVLGVNVFLRPGLFQCVGPEANHDAIMAWAEVVFRRAEQCGARVVVFGSGASRRKPDGWSVEQADEQFVSLLHRMGPVAAAHGMMVALETQRAEECNYINHIEHAARLVRGAGHESIRLLADLYHMAQVGDGPETLIEAGDLIGHVEIAEKDERTIPGVAGDDFMPYFSALRAVGYGGMICIEGRWQAQHGIAEVARAVATIREQAGI